MTRGENIARIHTLAAEVKAASVGVKTLSGERLEEHLAGQPDHMLGPIRRVYEGLLEEHNGVCAARTQTERP